LRCYTSEFLYFRKVVLDEVPPFVNFLVIVLLVFTGGFRRDHGGCAACINIFEQPILIEGSVPCPQGICASNVPRGGLQRITGHIADQRDDAFHVVRLS